MKVIYGNYLVELLAIIMLVRAGRPTWTSYHAAKHRPCQAPILV